MFSSARETFFLDMWYQQRWWAWLLLPLTWLFQSLAWIRKKILLAGATNSAVPIIVVGNINVGGTGKTPMVIALVETLKQRGFCPGIVSRGYGSRAPHYPFAVNKDSDVIESGDEPLLLAQRCQCPVMIGADRNASIERLVSLGVDVVVSDDGLQQYRMPRTVEIVLIDGERGLGNGFCLPAGPLRESARRLRSVDFVVINGEREPSDMTEFQIQTMQVIPNKWINLANGAEVAIEACADGYDIQDSSWYGDHKAVAISGIGNPQRFFNLLRLMKVSNVEPRAFPDHHNYTTADLTLDADTLVLTTEKDAVKLMALAAKNNLVLDNVWYLKISAQLPQGFFDSVAAKLSNASTSNL